MKRPKRVIVIILSVLILFSAMKLSLFQQEIIVCYFPEIFPEKMHIKRTQRQGSYVFLGQDKQARISDSSDYIHYWNTTHISPLYFLKEDKNDTLYVYGSIMEIHCPNRNVKKLSTLDSLSGYDFCYELEEERGVLRLTHIDSLGKRRIYRAIFDKSTGMMVKDSVPQYKRSFF